MPVSCTPYDDSGALIADAELRRRPEDLVIMEVQGYKLVTASPCEMNWDDMHGDEKRRFCHQCSLYVYDMAALDDDEQLDLIRMALKKDRVCARLYTRRDSKVLASDCPVGMRLARMFHTMQLAVWIIFTGIFTFGLAQGFQWAKQQLEVSLSQSFSTVVRDLAVTGNVYVDTSHSR